MGGETQTEQQSQNPAIPSNLWPLLLSGSGGLLSALRDIPSLSELYSGVPEQGVAPLTPQELATLNQFEGIGTGANAPESTALGTLANYASGPIGEDPATQAALQQFEGQTAPSIAQAAALQGQANSGAALQAQAEGEMSALAPYEENAQNLQSNAANALYGAGANLNQQDVANLQAKLQAEGMSQQEAQQLLNALYQQQEQQFNFASGLWNVPISLFPSEFGANSNSQMTSGPKW